VFVNRFLSGAIALSYLSIAEVNHFTQLHISKCYYSSTAMLICVDTYVDTSNIATSHVVHLAK
jgi:hypothetical protein